MIYKRKTITLSDKQYRLQTLAACCTPIPITTYKALLKDQSRISLTKKSIPFIKEDVKIVEKITTHYEKKEMISGIPVFIIAAAGTSYSRGGIKLSYDCHGETTLELDEDIQKKEKTMVNYLTRFGIPPDRICESIVDGTTVACINKYGKVGLESTPDIS